MNFDSFNTFAIRLVGDYAAKSTAQVKGKPCLIRASLIRNTKKLYLLTDGNHLLIKLIKFKKENKLFTSSPDCIVCSTLSLNITLFIIIYLLLFSFI
jgi:hypothetical protein